jgi:hypothetical protein
MQLDIKNNVELKKALNIIWMISVLMFLGILVLTLFYPENLILSKIPICENKKESSECFLCGSTRAFFEIRELNFAKAYYYNKGSVPLFIIMALNFLTYLFKNQINIKNFKLKL